jgi:hypothetical protein
MVEPRAARVVRPCLPTPRSSPWSSSPSSGPASEASEISGASLTHICAPTSLPSVRRATQPQGALCGARFARLPACSDPNALWRFGDLPCPGHHSHPGHREGRSFSQGAVFCGQATFGRSASKTEWVYGFKVALSVSPEGVIFAFGLPEAASDERPIGEFLIIEDSHDAYLWPTRALRAFSGSDAGLRTLSWRS